METTVSNSKKLLSSCGRPVNEKRQTPRDRRHISHNAQRRDLLRILIAAAKSKSSQGSTSKPAYLSDFIQFQSDDESEDEAGKSPEDAEALISRATSALEKARQALEKQQEDSPSRPIDSVFSYSNGRGGAQQGETSNWAEDDKSQEARRSSLHELFFKNESSFDNLDSVAVLPPAENGVDQSSSAPSWAQAPPSRDPEPQLQRQEEERSSPRLEFAEPLTSSLEYISQDTLDLQASKDAVLPPFQSVLELTSAAAPPRRNEEPVTSAASVSSAGRSMQDGEGQLADGTKYKRESGETKGKNGHWFRWTKLSGVSPAGKVEWEEKWWEVSDWAGMKELGAEKSGFRADGAAWRETWREAIGFEEQSGEPMIERTAHKWAQDAKGDEWEERWGEHYLSKGKARKWADKWGKEGANIWHERWGENYPEANSCVKYTDKWAERLLEEGGSEQWGENWEETFAHGKGGKKGETWTVDGSGHRYQRWWGENHFGDGSVQKFGNSTTGEHWDVVEQMDTYYNPIPHFGYRLALDHSPTLKNVPVLPRGGDDLSGGVADL